MSQKTNPTVIGVFVLVGLALALATGVILSSGSLFKETYPYVMVFDGNVSGLLPGAPVQYRGVTVGTVKEIKLVVNREKRVSNVPVIVELDPSLITFVGNESHDAHIQNEVNDGLRAQLESQSLVTGLQKIMLVDRPDVPINMRNMLDLDFPEIPTCPNLGESLINELQTLPFKEIVVDTHNTLKHLNELTASLTEEETIASAVNTLKAVERLSTQLEEQLPSLNSELTDTLKSIRDMAEDLEPVSASMSKELPEIIVGLDQNMKSFFELQKNLNGTLKELQLLLNRNSTSRYQITDSLATFTELAKKASQLFDYLERHPESILTGKPE